MPTIPDTTRPTRIVHNGTYAGRGDNQLLLVGYDDGFGVLAGWLMTRGNN
jgi:hypothetical protein